LANMGVFTARELGRGPRPDAATAEAVDLALVEELRAGLAGGAAAERAVVLADVLADRNAAGARPAVQEALLAVAAAGPKRVRLAAIDALGRIGDAAVVIPLLSIATDPDAGFAVAVRGAIAGLPAGAVNDTIRKRLAEAEPGQLPLLVGITGDRRIPAVAELVALADHPDEDVRTAALAGLGAVVDLEHLDAVVARAVAPRSEAEADAARRALLAASVRMPDRDGCAAKLAAAIETAPAAMKVMLLDTLGEVGGGRALLAMAAAAKSGVKELDDAATRLLGTWMTADAAPVLLEIAQPGSPSRFRSRALRGYLRIARQFDLPVEERAAMCRQALAVAVEDVDRTAVLEILKRYPAPATLAVAREATAVPGLADEAQAAVVTIMEKLPK
jgi:HEAT repeat protein